MRLTDNVAIGFWEWRSIVYWACSALFPPDVRKLGALSPEDLARTKRYLRRERKAGNLPCQFGAAVWSSASAMIRNHKPLPAVEGGLWQLDQRGRRL
jgi:hypothetical protein